MPSWNQKRPSVEIPTLPLLNGQKRPSVDIPDPEKVVSNVSSHAEINNNIADDIYEVVGGEPTDNVRDETQHNPIYAQPDEYAEPNNYALACTYASVE